MGLIHKIKGVDVTTRIEKGVRITQQIGSKSDTAAFFIEDTIPADAPVVGQEYILFEPDGVTRIYGGIIAKAQRVRLGPEKDGFKVKVQDFSKLVEKRLVLRAFTQRLAGDIFKEILTDFVKDPSITTTFVLDGPVIDFIGFNFKNGKKALDEVAKQAGMDWYIDENKVVHLFFLETSSAPLIVDKNETRIRDFKFIPNFTQLKNRVIVRGGTSESILFEETYEGDNSRNTFPVSYRPTAIPVVKVQNQIKSVGIKNKDDGQGFGFLFDPNNKVLENDAEPVLGPNKDLIVEYKFKIPILVQVEDAASISEVAAVEGSDGVYEAIIVDDSIETLVGARERAQAEINRFSRLIFKGSFETHVDGFKQGQLLTVSFPEKGLSVQGLVERVVREPQNSGLSIYKITFSSLPFGFEDFLLGLFDDTRKISVREGEVLDDLQLILEQLPVVDSPILILQNAPPFTWGPGGNVGIWNEFEWA